MRPLAQGAKGPDVGAWQRLLCACGLEVAVDETFGSRTMAATETLQARCGLVPTGRADRATQRLALFELAELAGALCDAPPKG